MTRCSVEFCLHFGGFGRIFPFCHIVHLRDQFFGVIVATGGVFSEMAFSRLSSLLLIYFGRLFGTFYTASLDTLHSFVGALHWDPSFALFQHGRVGISF